MKALIVLAFLWNVNAEMINKSRFNDSRIVINGVEKQNIEADIQNIRGQCLKINSALKSYRLIKNDFPDRSTEGGGLKGYYKGKDLKKIVAVYFGEMGKAEEEYYFENSQLIFLYRKNHSYDKPTYLANFKIKSVAEDRFYFKNEVLIRWLKPGNKIVQKTSRDFKETYLDIRVLVEELKNKLSQN